MFKTGVVHLPEMHELAHGEMVAYNLYRDATPRPDHDQLSVLAFIAGQSKAELGIAGHAGAPAPDTIYWFRWIAGHQVAVIAWIMLIEEINQCRVGCSTPETARARCVALLRLYSSMLVYTASCSPAVYENTIRRFMITYHPAFSATWALDYCRLKKYIKEWAKDAPQYAEVWRAYIDTVQIHGKIGRRLIGNAASLLQLARDTDEACKARTPETDLAFTFDSFFLVKRTRVSTAQLWGQLTSRLCDIVVDCKLNGYCVEGGAFPAEFTGLPQRCWDELIDNAVQASRLLRDPGAAPVRASVHAATPAQAAPSASTLRGAQGVDQ